MEKDGEELVLNIALRSNSSTAVYQAMQDMWKAIGVHVEIDAVENTSEHVTAESLILSVAAGRP